MRAGWIQYVQLQAIEMLRKTPDFSNQAKLFAMLLSREGFPDAEKEKKDIDISAEQEIPWSSIYHKSREIMGMSDDEFWDTSPRKFFAMLNEALVFRGIKKGPEPEQFMDDLF